MFQIGDQQLALAASDLTNHLACTHLTHQQLAIARGERGRPRPADDPHADLIRERGDVHEAEQLAALSADCGGHVDLTLAPVHTRDGLLAANARTAEAMQGGHPLIYQPTLFDGTWQGRADFLRRVDRPSELGDYSYEVLDTKLSRHVKPAYVHQLLLYSALVAGIQRVGPELAHVVLGDGTTESLRISDYAALHGHVVRTVEDVAAAPGVGTYPEPVSHCGVCALAWECRQRLLADDHLSLVAGAHRKRRELLGELGIGTVADMAAVPEDLGPGALGGDQFALLRSQAALQVESRESGEPTRRYRDPLAGAGYARLPEPSKGDVFFDLEGDPYVDLEGLEYLWGWWTDEGGYRCIWAHDKVKERLAFEAFVDEALKLRAQHPKMHIYHYAPHERAKLGSLAAKYGTREAEVDALFREGVLVDLMAVVKQGMQVGEESYSLKRLERHHGFERLEHRVREGGGSIVAYETWLKTEAEELLDAIRAYNEEDCRSTASLRDWIHDVTRPEAEAQFDVGFLALAEPEEEERTEPDWLAGVIELVERLTADLGPDPDADSAEQARRRLLAHLLLFHRRESNPEWWSFFSLKEMSVEDLFWERDAITGLQRDESVPLIDTDKSWEYTFRFPPQEFKFGTDRATDPETDATHKLSAIGDDWLRIKRGKKAEPPAPRALIAGGAVDVTALRNSLMTMGESVLAGDGRFRATVALLDRESPRTGGTPLGDEVDDLTAAALALDNSILPIQGPPGTGKTYGAARMVVAALDAGLRVGVTGPSHAAIKNLLSEIEDWAGEAGVTFGGVYKGDDYESSRDLIEVVGDNKAVTEDFQLVAGTAWLFARAEQREKFALLFIDEASQYSLANAVAAAPAAASVVLLGDPQQLPQVTKASHPEGSGRAVLEHILDGEDTIPSGKGVFLPSSWRMHPEVCSFVSERSYESRLRSREECALRRIDAQAGQLTGAGLRAIAIEHEGRSQKSPEEADAIASACRDLLSGARVTDDEGQTGDLAADDILVVAPYNLAVQEISRRVPEGVRVGTVDRFQGQEAPIVFYALTCSSGEDVPRGLDFLFDRNRLNVAVSRAQCMSVLVYNPRLLDADCPTLEAMRLLDGVCRYVEVAEAVDVGALGTTTMQ